MAQQQKDSHSRKHWDGPHWGPDGAVKEGMFKFLSTLIAARKSAPTRFHKFGVVVGILIFYAMLRFGYELKDHNANELDILASSSRGLRQRQFAIRCGEFVLNLQNTSFTTKMLIFAGLMRDYEAILPLRSGGQESGAYFRMLADNYNGGEYDPPEQQIRVLRAMAWFTNMYGSPEETITFVGIALTLARQLGANDQFEAIKREFPDYVF